jgi:hypothetical protein
MSREMTIGAYNTVRKALLTVWSTGEVVKNPWFLQGLDAEGEYSKQSMIDLCVSQVFLLRNMYNKDNAVHMTLKRATAKVKYIIYVRAKKHLEDDMHLSAQKKYETVSHFFRVQLGEEESWWTYKLIPVSKYMVENYEGDEDIFSKFIKRADGWYTMGWATKTKYVDPERTKYLKSGKQERFNILDNRIGVMENEWVNDCMLWEHLVDCYACYKVPYQASYGDIILAYNGEKNAPYCQRTARNKLKDFFIKAFLYYGIDIKHADATFHRDCTEMLDVYGTLDMLLKERKRGYSVADVLNR